MASAPSGTEPDFTPTQDEDGGGALNDPAGSEPKRESIAEFAARVRAECFPSSRVDQAQQLSAAVRRLAKRGIDSTFTVEAAEFDDLLLRAMRVLNEIVHDLQTVRERVDLAKIAEERAARAWFAPRRAGAIAARARKIPPRTSGRDLGQRLARELERLSPEARAELITRLKGDTE